MWTKSGYLWSWLFASAAERRWPSELPWCPDRLSPLLSSETLSHTKAAGEWGVKRGKNNPPWRQKRREKNKNPKMKQTGLRSKLVFNIRPVEGGQPEEQWEWECNMQASGESFPFFLGAHAPQSPPSLPSVSSSTHFLLFFHARHRELVSQAEAFSAPRTSWASPLIGCGAREAATGCIQEGPAQQIISTYPLKCALLLWTERKKSRRSNISEELLNKGRNRLF